MKENRMIARQERLWRILIIAVTMMAASLALLLAPPATDRSEAASVRVSCDIYATNRVDPIVLGSGHLHDQIGNLSTSDSSTYESLHASKATSCDGAFWTNAGWFPVEQNEPVSGVDVYYRGPGNQRQIHDIPDGLQMVAHGAKYNCGAGPLNPSPFQSSPVYSCTQNWGTSVTFPACYDGSGALTPEHTIYGPNRTSCPSGYTRLPEVNYLVMHKNLDGKVPMPLMVSAGVDTWESYTSMHADYFFAAQDEFQKDVDLNGDGTIQRKAGGYNETNLLDLCVRQAPDALAYNNERCRTSGLLPAHARAINNYYN
jgi:Domain of unknown function (DUF1996)